MNNTEKQLLSIGKAAQYLGLTTMTLRRWDEDGSFKPSFVSSGGHRFYSVSDLEKKIKGVFRVAEDWVGSDKIYNPESEFYCRTIDVFKARFERMAHEFEKYTALQMTGSLITSAAGEIGNNSFDHNLGNWPDVMGTFFAYDLGKHRIVLADRGLGVLATLRRIRPELKNDEEALKVAFTEYVTGRAPEHRGNGLKFVMAAIEQAEARLFFQSGEAMLEINKSGYVIKKADHPINGCLTLIEF